MKTFDPIARAVLDVLDRSDAPDVGKEIAPGVDLQTAILDQSEFPLIVSDRLKTMDAELFAEAPIGLTLPRKPAREFFPERGTIGLRCREICLRNGLVMRAVWDTMIVAPPLVITRAQIDEMMLLIRRCLDLTLADAQQRGWIA